MAWLPITMISLTFAIAPAARIRCSNWVRGIGPALNVMQSGERSPLSLRLSKHQRMDLFDAWPSFVLTPQRAIPIILALAGAEVLARHQNKAWNELPQLHSIGR